LTGFPPLPEGTSLDRPENVVLTLQEIDTADQILRSLVKRHCSTTGIDLEYLSFQDYRANYGQPTSGTWEDICERSRLVSMWCDAAMLQIETVVDTRPTASIINFWGEIVMTGDLYKANGPVAQQGQNNLNNGTITQNVTQDGATAQDIANLLAVLHSAMARQAVEPEQVASAQEIKQAKSAAEAGDIKTTISHLKAAGEWSMKVAEKIGIGLAIAGLKTAAGW
jgi:ABC-type metal ion transport system substrate-binding protein